jgi:hypothetical protein
MADPPLDLRGSEGGLVLAVALAPLLRAVGVADGHADDRDRMVRAANWDDARDPPAGADDDVAADLLAQDAIRAADVVLALRRDRRRLEAEACLADGGRGLVGDAVLRCAALLERKVVAGEIELETDDFRREQADRFVQQFLPGLVSFEYDDRLSGHGEGV